MDCAKRAIRGPFLGFDRFLKDNLPKNKGTQTGCLWQLTEVDWPVLFHGPKVVVSEKFLQIAFPPFRIGFRHLLGHQFIISGF